MKINVGFLYGVICLGSFCASVYAAEPQVREVIVHETKGPVQARIGAEDWADARAGMVLHEKDEIRTGEKGTAVLMLDQGAETGKLELREKSLLKMDTLQTDLPTEEKVTYLDLALGKVLVHAGKLKGDSKFEVRTPTATAGVRGTVFEVSVDK